MAVQPGRIQTGAHQGQIMRAHGLYADGGDGFYPGAGEDVWRNARCAAPEFERRRRGAEIFDIELERVLLREPAEPLR